MAWHLSGEYFENCNCDILCPCITSAMAGAADNERCLVPIIGKIGSGELGGVSLDGLSFVMVADAPAVMGSGGARVALYIDERADGRQREALVAILSGAEGGPPAVFAAITGEVLGVKYVPIAFSASDGRRRAEIPGIMEVEVEALRHPETGAVMEITNTIHPFGSDLPIAKSLVGRFNDPDYGLSFDNTGKNGHFRDFAWRV